MKEGKPIPCDNEVEKQMRGVSYNAKAIFFPQSRPQRTFHGGRFIFHVSDPRNLCDPDWLYSSYDERGALAGLPGGRLSDIRTFHRKYDYRLCGRTAALAIGLKRSLLLLNVLPFAGFTMSGGSAALLNMLHGFFAIGAVLAPFLVLWGTRRGNEGWHTAVWNRRLSY